MLPAAQLINSPYDLDARYGKKRTTLWVGYKVHFTQTCDKDAPQLITHVETTQAPLPDEGALSAIHTDLAEKELLPEHHLVDAGYVTIANLVKTSSDYGVDPAWVLPSRLIGIKQKPATISRASPSIGRPRQ